jgi:murein DD-endopeptidase
MSELNWQKLAEINKKRFENGDERERFATTLLQFVGTPYRWGNEVPEGSDCSGAICFALAASTGLARRLTAESLFRTVFTVQGPAIRGIAAVFFVASREKKEGGKTIPAGAINHVAGIVAEGIAVNMSEPKGSLREISDLKRVYDRFGYDLVMRGLNREAWTRIAYPVQSAKEFDPEFQPYFEGASA